MVLSKASEYAIRAVLYVALVGRKSYTPIREISDSLDISFHFLTKIFQTLTDQGILESYRGPKGGIMLIKPADELTLYDLVLAVDGGKLFEVCVLGLERCKQDTPCPVHDKWDPIREDIRHTLMNETVGHLVRKMQDGELRLANNNEYIQNWYEALKVMSR